MNDNPFEIKEEACASSPDHRRYLLIQAVDTETGEIVWAVGDDQICAVTRADFITRDEAVTRLGRLDYLSGIARSAFHFTAMRITEDGKVILFDSSRLFGKE